MRGLRQAKKIFPKLAIITCLNDPIIDKYINLKKAYGEDILVDVEVYKVSQEETAKLIEKLNNDDSVHGIIVQLPLPKAEDTDEIVNKINPKKDVDSLGKKSNFDPATPTAIVWLLNGHNIQLVGKKIAVVGQGRLVGAPLTKMLANSGLNPTKVDIDTKDVAKILKDSEIIISAVGKPDLIKAEMIQKNAVIIDAGTSSENGNQKGDVANDVYELQDITITPKIGGVGPLTVAALFDNLIRAAGQYA